MKVCFSLLFHRWVAIYNLTISPCVRAFECFSTLILRGCMFRRCITYCNWMRWNTSSFWSHSPILIVLFELYIFKCYITLKNCPNMDHISFVIFLRGLSHRVDRHWSAYEFRLFPNWSILYVIFFPQRWVSRSQNNNIFLMCTFPMCYGWFIIEYMRKPIASSDPRTGNAFHIRGSAEAIIWELCYLQLLNS